MSRKGRLQFRFFGLNNVPYRRYYEVASYSDAFSDQSGEGRGRKDDQNQQGVKTVNSEGGGTSF
ncbi:MAG TPA: hypothetical protein VFD78_06760 [Chitinophagaceae bacterium]|nr:hypothetical protein [Chitinophagaceae bacterium]